MDLNELTARFSRLEDERGIVRTLYRYAHAQYDGDQEKFVDCFTDDAVIERAAHDHVVRGRDEIEVFFNRITHLPEACHKHLVFEPIIDIDGDTATVSSDFLYIQDRDSGPFISHFGHYTDEMVRGADGVWRFRYRRLGTEATAPGRIGTVKGDPTYRG